ncbi:hypothetical protein ACIBI3_44670, partial [Actinomadura luteofluorescens]
VDSKDHAMAVSRHDATPSDQVKLIHHLRGRNLVKLDRAATLARNSREAEACELATQTLLELPAEQRTTIVFVRARDVRSALPAHRRRNRALNTFEEALALDTATIPGRRDA